MLTVFVITRDWLLRAGVRAELREKGIEALGMETIEDAGQAIAAGTSPTVVILEGGGIEGTSREAAGQLARRVPTIIVASRSEPIQIEGAAVLYRPVRVGDVVARVIELLQGRPA